MKLNKKMILTSIIVLIMLLCTSTVHAAIQSSGGTAANYNMDTWIKGIRQMESVGGGFGLSETINSNLTSSSGSNNIDVHMEKNTEYGAMAILSASSYGNPTKIEDGQTTTGNETGIVMKLNSEWVAAGIATYSPVFSNCDSKYKNWYEDDKYVRKIGDAISETKGWHGINNSYNYYWLRSKGYSCLIRAKTQSIFSYNGNAFSNDSAYEDGYKGGPANYYQVHPTRCVVIVGEGI